MTVNDSEKIPGCRLPDRRELRTDAQLFLLLAHIYFRLLVFFQV